MVNNVRFRRRFDHTILKRRMTSLQIFNKTYAKKFLVIQYLVCFAAFWCVNAFTGHFDGDILPVFCVAVLEKKHTVLPLMMILGNHCLGTSLYKFALGEYEIVYHQLPNDYLICLCMAVTYNVRQSRCTKVLRPQDHTCHPGENCVNYRVI